MAIEDHKRERVAPKVAPIRRGEVFEYHHLHLRERGFEQKSMILNRNFHHSHCLLLVELQPKRGVDSIGDV